MTASNTILEEHNPCTEADHYFALHYDRTIGNLRIAANRITEILENLANPDDPDNHARCWTQLRELADHAGYSGTIQAALADVIANAGTAVGIGLATVAVAR